MLCHRTIDGVFGPGTKERAIDKPPFAAKEPKPRECLIDVQDDEVGKRDFSVLIVINGGGGAGKSAAFAGLCAWLDLHDDLTTWVCGQARAR